MYMYCTSTNLQSTVYFSVLTLALPLQLSVLRLQLTLPPILLHPLGSSHQASPTSNGERAIRRTCTSTVSVIDQATVK